MALKLIVLLGAARSGTTFLGRTSLSRCSNLEYWGEPYHVWVHGHAYRKDDVLGADDATPEISHYIRKRLEERLAKSGKEFLLEKTPSNCLRIPFIREIFPEARFIHLFRDPAAAIASTVKEWRGDGHEALDSKELRQGGRAVRVGKGMRAYLKIRERVEDMTDLLELPAYLPRFIRFCMRNWTTGKDFTWGPRFPGMRAFRRTHTLHETCAEQWRWQVEGVLDHTADLGPDRLYTMSFEDLMTNPEEQLKAVMNWMGGEMRLEVLKGIVKSVQSKRASGRDPLAGLPDQERENIRAIVSPVASRMRLRKPSN
ncbi:sulfotransferase [Puniceicoccales bacterium CK1056]|uniref:Sulfotransferase n=1 Tax=Oceanipulchritudo coccoides TaxID=2706888 RepID=A0A6B2M4N1_9BACT|nr:sulfotransferase [Oceanipulchritudo coccoides]NDV63037.1 sulfotransferase [Oceanipulchritudo coccoides]